MRKISKKLFPLVLFLMLLASWVITPAGKKYVGVVGEDFKGISFFRENENNLTIDFPIANSVVGGTFEVKGRGRVFENQANIRVRDAKTMEVLLTDNFTILSPDPSKFGPWVKEIDFSKFNGKESVILEVYDLSPKDGAEVDLVSIPLVIRSQILK